MNIIIKIILFITGLFFKIFSYTILFFIISVLVLFFLIYINFGKEINIIIEKIHEVYPQATLI